jgi:hypothetical protein
MWQIITQEVRRLRKRTVFQVYTVATAISQRNQMYLIFYDLIFTTTIANLLFGSLAHGETIRKK